MAIPRNIGDLEQSKFIEDSGNVAIRVVLTTASNTSSALAESIDDLEYNKFVEDDFGNTAIVLSSV
jgi:hypothetical protein